MSENEYPTHGDFCVACDENLSVICERCYKDLITKLTEARADVPALVARVRELEAESRRFRDWYRNAFGGPSKRETPWDPCACEECESLRRLKDERLKGELPVHPSNLTDVVSLLEDERDELLVRVANQDAELRATREAYIDAKWTNAYRRGAEAMREACIAWARAPEIDWEALPDVLEEMPIPEEP